MVSVLVWQPLVVETYWLAEEQKEERYYPHRNHHQGDFFVLIGGFHEKGIQSL